MAIWARVTGLLGQKRNGSAAQPTVIPESDSEEPEPEEEPESEESGSGVVIAGLADAAVVARAVGSIFIAAFEAPFEVEPAAADCTDYRVGDQSVPAAVSLNDNDGAHRSLRVVAYGLGEVTVRIVCETSDHSALSG